MRRLSPNALRTAAVALGLALLLDSLRVWLPSVIFVYGRAGTTPPTEMGAFALLPFVLAFGGALAVRVLPARLVAGGAAVVLVAGRLAVQLTTGGDPQLWAATIAVVGGLVWVVAVAGGAVSGRIAAVGLVLGLTVDAGGHALLRSTALAWREELWPWLILLLAAVVLFVGIWRWWPPAPEAGTPWTGAARGWVTLGPLLVLHGVLGGVVAHLQTVTTWPEPVAAGLVVGAHGMAAVAGWWAAVGGSGRSAARAGAVVVLAGLGALMTLPPVPGEVFMVPRILAATGHVLLPIGTALILGGLVSAPGTTQDAPRAAACAVGLLAFLALAFGYYAAYDLLLPVHNTVFLWAAAGLAAFVAVVATATPRLAAGDVRARVVAGAAGAVAAGLLAGAVVGAAADPVEPAPGDGFPVRVMTYNLQMGFDIHGRHSVDRLAAVIAREEPVVAGVQEVSRGWLINSATDVLPRLAEQTGMGYEFTPAADSVWGNAILSRHPVEMVEEVGLPRGEAPMPRSAQAAVVHLGGGHELGVVNTHLSHRDEDAGLRAEQVAVIDEVARGLAAEGRPVVVLGDLNAEPGTPELAPLEAWLTHAYDDPPAGTWPSWGPVEHIDHIMHSDELRATDYRVPVSHASDHLPAAATLDLDR